MRAFKNVQEFEKAFKEFTKNRSPFYFWDEEYDGSCPCSEGEIVIGKHFIHIETNCWRISTFYGYQDLLIKTDNGTFTDLGGEWIKLILDELNKTKWYNSYRLHYVEVERGNETNLENETDFFYE